MRNVRGKRVKMRESEQGANREGTGGLDRGFEGHRRRQARLGLGLSPAERLRWLEETMEELRGLLGRARYGRPVSQEADRPQP